MGEAGGSAERRAEELRARGLKSAGAWAAGALGERRVAGALADLPPEWLVLHDRLLFPGLTESNLDHVLVGPAGVVLIDAKNWSGQLTEWEGGLFKHQYRPDGSPRHVPVHREVDNVLRMGTEMARRLKVRVLCVVALAGASADGFGEARLVRNVWVVPVSQLAAWLATRPVIAPDEAQRLGVLVRTEFPSTTTDWRLLAAIGHDLDRRGLAPEYASGSRATGRVWSRAAAGPSARKKSTRPPTRRRRFRPLISLAGVGILLWALQAGGVSTVLATAGSAFAGRVAESAGVGISAAPRKDAMTCADIDPTSVKQLRTFELVTRESAHACQYRTTVGGSVRTVLGVKEGHPYYPMTTQLAKSRKAKAPIVTVTSGPAGKVTLLYVSKGVTLELGKTSSVPATRDLEVLLAHEALGLTAKQGKQLAIRVAMGVTPPEVPSAPASG